MISLSTLAQNLQNGLNALGSDQFAIFTDVGEFKKAYKQGNTTTHYINGIFEAMSPTRLAMKNLEVLTQSFRVSFVCDVALLNKNDDGEFIEVVDLRKVLESYIKANNAISYSLTDTSGTTFNVTPAFDGITVGTISQMSPIGEVLPVYLDFSCAFVQSGANTNDVEFIINGENMFVQEYSATRTRTAETNMIATETSSKTVAQANGLSLHLTMPLLDTTISKAIEDDVWGGTQNTAVCVERYRENATNPYKCYIMIYGNNSETGKISYNVGQSVDFVEGKQDILDYGTGWTTQTITTTEQGEVVEITLGEGKHAVFFGDGTSEHIEATTTTHTYITAGTYYVRIFTY